MLEALVVVVLVVVVVVVVWTDLHTAPFIHSCVLFLPCVALSSLRGEGEREGEEEEEVELPAMLLRSLSKSGNN
ncbi:hypothetical protein E2C01_088818 [Portunus trituberculatus]|uniref:Uncharacterized protein n=1 Tax=Portunus trituberculatus TaxID=210409 RepID=A0A5B7JAC8_PORTR|nr:hypothetical protein [Portunus trituberculatus]